MNEKRISFLLSLAFALWGFAIAIAMITVWRRHAPPDQMMGLAKTMDLDAAGPMRWMFCLMLLPVIVPLVMRPVTRLLAAGEAWARNTAMIAPIVVLWLVTAHMSVSRAIAPFAIVILILILARRRVMEFSRLDVVLVPVFLTTLIAIVDITRWSIFDCVPVAAILILVLRIAVTYIPSPLPPALAFLAAPLAAILQTGFFARDQRYFGWHALVVVIVSPFVVRFFVKNRSRALKALTMIVFPLALFAYWNSMNLSTAEGKPRMNFFEDGHSLLPATEYLRGERPYRDMLPAHGLIEDGFFDYLVFQTGEVNAGRRTKAREVIGTLNAIALYVLAWAVTGSAEAAVLTVLLSIMTGLFAPTIRMLPPIATLALIAGAVRWRRPRWFAYAGFMTVVCGATSLDFGAYALVTLVIAVVRWRGGLKPALRGLACGVVPLFLAFALFGILDDFFYGTFVEVLTVAPAYSTGFFAAPESLAARPYFPDALGGAFEPRIILYIVWPMLAIFTGAAIARRWPRRFEPMVIVALWAVLTGISYAERHHRYFGMAAIVIFIAIIVRLLRRQKPLAIALIALAFILSSPTIHLAIVGTNRTTRKPPKDWVEINDIPRARGATWHASDAAAIRSVQKYIDLSLAPDETFFDFANSGTYYFLFNRDCPIREYEVAFYQTDEQQREVIRHIESNPKVRAALIPNTPHGRISVDIPNVWRAPLVQQYLTQNFELDFEEGEVAFWRRK